MLLLPFGMRVRRPFRDRAAPARVGWGVWLGCLALALNALVPVHFAFDAAEALSHGAAAKAPSLQAHIIALLAGHPEADPHAGHDHTHHHRPECPVCASTGTLAGFALSAPVLIPAPVATTAAVSPEAFVPRAAKAPLLGYLSRAPPSP